MTNQIDKAPVGATHRYFHGSDMDWYCYTDRGLYRWQQGSWCASVHKTIEALADSCPLGRLEAIPAKPAQPVEDDLTWLVHETKGEWFGNATLIARDGLEDYLWAGPSLQNMVHRYPGYHWFTKEEYLARRAELQNKPSWKDAPEWANYLAIDGDSVWYWHEMEPKTVAGCEYWMSRGQSGIACRGELLGDWRDTLERRPASAGISGSEAAVGLAAFQVKSTIHIDWSTAPEGATHHIGGGKLERPWHQELSHIRYWNGEKWVKRTAFRTTDEANAKGFAVVARPEHLGWAPTLPVEHIKFNVHVMEAKLVTQRLDEATQNVLAAAPGLMDEKYRFDLPVRPDLNVIPEGARSHADQEATRTAMLYCDLMRRLRSNPEHLDAKEFAAMHQLCDAELTKRDAAVCGGQKYLDAHWFERGELPPAGEMCVLHAAENNGEEVMFIGVTSDSCPVFETAQKRVFVERGEYKFTPIRTERDVLLSVIVEEMNHYDTDGKLADAILAAGFKRDGGA